MLPFAKDRYGLRDTVQGQHKRPTIHLDRKNPFKSSNTGAMCGPSS